MGDAQTTLLAECDRKLNDAMQTVATLSGQFIVVTDSTNIMYFALVLSTLVESLHSQVSYYAYHFCSILESITDLGLHSPHNNFLLFCRSYTGH